MQNPHAYLVLVGENTAGPGFKLAKRLREKCPALRLIVNMNGGPFKKQFMRADKSNAEVALILGDDEIARGEVGVKFLRKDESQKTFNEESLIAFLQDLVQA
jgi:histidyl-tRNA synthetase